MPVDKITSTNFLLTQTNSINQNQTQSPSVFGNLDMTGGGGKLTQDFSFDLKEKFRQAQNTEGNIGKGFNELKNIFGIGLNSNKVNAAIEKYENGEISYGEAENLINKYKAKQEKFVNAFANVLSIGATALVAMFSGKVNVASGAAIGGSIKAGLKTYERATNGVKGDTANLKCIMGDTLTGAINGAAATALTRGITQARAEQKLLEAPKQELLLEAPKKPMLLGAPEKPLLLNPHIENADVAKRAAARVTEDKEIQQALVEMVQNEGIIIRTKEDAIPILKRQYAGLSEEARNNLYVLNINPQTNNGMPKSNTLISKWYAEANGIDPSRVITVETSEMTNKKLVPATICKEWGQGSKTGSLIQRRSVKIKPEANKMTIHEARALLDRIKGLPEKEILKCATTDDIACTIQRINNDVITPYSKGGYTSALSSQVQSAISNSNGRAYFVIPDDCSLSGSSILCDTARIVDKSLKNNPQSSAGFIFSPMVYGDKAEEVISQFALKEGITDEAFLTRINAITPGGEDKFSGAKKVFRSIQGMENVDFQVADGAKKAVHFTETATFKKLGETNPQLQQKLLYVMQGPVEGGGHIYGGFGDCGVMVITPTETFNLEGVQYAGKVPTNSVGFMEAVGLEAGVLNDNLPKDTKGLFIKGTGKGYQRYLEWGELAHPTKVSDRTSIIINNGLITKVS